MSIDKQAQYESKFSRLWERYDEASHCNAEQMRDILEVTLDALESAERQILRLEKLAEARTLTVKLPTFEGYVPHVVKELQSAFREQMTAACCSAGIQLKVEE